MKRPPTDIEAERAALGSVLIDAAALDDLRDVIRSPEDFWDQRHAAAYRAMLSLAESGTPIDCVSVTGKIIDMGLLESTDWSNYQVEVIDSVPNAIAATYYAGRVAEKALRRRLIEQQETALNALYDDSTPSGELIDSAVSRLIDMRPSVTQDEAHISHWLDEALEDDRPVIHSGMKALDDIVEGFELGTLTVIGARPSVGKTAWGISATLNMIDSGTPVGFVSAEMVGRRVGRRLVCAEVGISTKEFDRDKHAPEIRSVIARQRDLPLWVDQTPGIHIDRVCSRIRRWHRQHEIQVAYVDYLQLLAGDGDSEYERVTRATQKLQALAKELDVAVFALAQVNRHAMSRADKKPTMSDLKGSGEIEQAADVILLLHRESYEASGTDVLEGTVKGHEAEIIVAKNRDGRTDTAHVGWVGRCGVFSSGARADTVGLEVAAL